MLALFAAALAASSTSAPSSVPTPLDSSTPWWERITVTVDDKGEQQRCQYETSVAAGATSCDEDMAASIGSGKGGKSGTYSKVTFERRFSPGARLDGGTLRPGDTLLGRQVMYLTFDASGAVDSCKVVAATGQMEFSYDCDAARKEEFRARASAGEDKRQAFLTVLAYGHNEHIA